MSPVLLKVYTKGLAELNQYRLSKILTLADSGLINIIRNIKGFQEAAETVQQLDSISKWCHDTGSFSDPDRTQTLWCILTTEQQANQCQWSHLME